MHGFNSEQAVHVLFLESRADDHILNRMSAAIGRMTHGMGACHVELCLPEGSQYVSASIYNGEKITMSAQKTFANPGYTVHTIAVSQDQVMRMKQHATKCMNKNLYFDKLGMYLAVLPFAIPFRSSQGTFCSKLVTEMLQAADVQAVNQLNASTTSPSKLWKTLRSCGRSATGSVPFKENIFRETASFEKDTLISQGGRW